MGHRLSSVTMTSTQTEGLDKLEFLLDVTRRKTVQEGSQQGAGGRPRVDERER